MNLPFLKKSGAKTSRDYLFALEIDHHLVKSSVWSVINGKPQVFSVGTNAKWDDRTEESLIQACDHSLTDSTSRLDRSGKIQPEKVILGLPADWVGEEKIHQEKLKVLKSLSAQLSLSVVGFVVTSEAVVDHLQRLEGVPPTAILIGVQPHQLDITLVRLGKSEGTQAVVRGPKIALDVIEGLSRFSHVNMFPSRILLYDSNSDMEDLRQHLLAYPWLTPQTRLPFLHFPKIEALPTDFSISAISLSGGLEVARATGMLVQSPPSSKTDSAVPAVELTPEELGFVIDKDIDTPESKEAYSEIPATPTPNAAEESTAIADNRPKPKLALPKLPLPKITIPALPKFLPSSIFLTAIGFALLLLIGVFAAYWYLPKSTVTLTVRSETISHQFEAAASTQLDSLSLENLVLPASVVSVEVSEEKTAPSTGSKLIGDPATGEVTIINGTSQFRSFPSGTVIMSPEGLKFLLLNEVFVASASGTADPNSYQPGKATVKVKADQIGSESNLSAGTQFKVGSFSSLDFVAKNDTAFSGGSSRTVKVVSKSDVSGLKTSLYDSIKAKAMDQLSLKVPDGKKIVPESTVTQILSEELSHKVDEAADEFTLRMTVKAQSLVISDSDLYHIVSEQIKSQIPPNYSLTDDISYKFDFKAKKDGQKSLLTVTVTAVLLPTLDQEKVKLNLAGKHLDLAVDYLKTLPGVSRVDITSSPPLPKAILTMPRIPGNITLEILPSN